MTDRLEPQTIVDGRYRIERRLGSGGMADVYCATDMQLDRQVALKLLYSRYAQDAEFVERFRREASAAAGLQQPHVVSVYDRGSWGSTFYIAMEYLGGRSLKALIHEEAPLEQGRAIGLARQILSAAGFAHRHGIIHRDLKPQNVIVDSEDFATVTDFGIARSGASDMTQTGSIMGTAQYLSPEQAQGHAVGATSDVYSVGIILYEMLTGRVPFEGDSAVAIALKQVGEQPVPPSRINPAIGAGLENVVLRALEKDPAARYASCEEFMAALEHLDEGPPTSMTMVAAPPGVAHTPAAPPRYAAPPDEERPSRGWLWFTLAALVAVGVLIAALLLTRKDQVVVPNVVNSDVAAARAALEHEGFKADPVERQATQPAGQVIGQSPEGGTKADEGSTVVLTVSGGPGTAQVPTVEGLSQASARRRLETAGFDVRVREEASSDVDEGKAIGTEPGAGTPLERGGEVTLLISSGKQQVDVPDVVGEPQADAERTLRDAGLEVRVSEQEDDSRDPGTVLSQSPSAGSKAADGSTVTLVVAKAPSQVEVPDTVGDDESSAIERLSGAGFRVRRTLVDVTGEQDDGVVQTQDPAGGEQAKPGDRVTIGVGRFTPAPDPGAGTGGGATPGDGTAGG